MAAHEHSGVTFDAERINLVLADSEVILRLPKTVISNRRLCFEAVVLLEVQWENCYTTW